MRRAITLTPIAVGCNGAVAPAAGSSARGIAVVVDSADIACAMGAVAVEVARVVVGRCAVFTGPATGQSGNEVISDPVVDIAVAIVVNAGRTVLLGKVDPHVAVGRRRGRRRRCRAAKVLVVIANTGIHYGNDNTRISGLDIPGFRSVDVFVICRLIQMPLFRIIESVVGGGIEGMNADRFYRLYHRIIAVLSHDVFELVTTLKFDHMIARKIKNLASDGNRCGAGELFAHLRNFILARQRVDSGITDGDDSKRRLCLADFANFRLELYNELIRDIADKVGDIGTNDIGNFDLRQCQSGKYCDQPESDNESAFHQFASSTFSVSSCGRFCFCTA